MKKTITLNDLTGKDTDNIENENVIVDNDINDKISLLALTELINMDNLPTITRLKVEQVPIITKLNLFADTFKVPFAEQLSNNIMKLQISINGLGRRELVQMVRQRDEVQEVKKLTAKDIFRWYYARYKLQ